MRIFKIYFILSFFLVGCSTIAKNPGHAKPVKAQVLKRSDDGVYKISNGGVLPKQAEIKVEDLPATDFQKDRLLAEEAAKKALDEKEVYEASKNGFINLSSHPQNLEKQEKKEENFMWIMIFFLILHLMSVIWIARSKWLNKLLR